MQIESLVETVGDFSQLEMEWGFTYPKKGEILVVSNITQHPNDKNRKKGIVLLHFNEYPKLFGICDKTYKGEPNFIELQPPLEVSIEKLCCVEAG